MVLVTLRYSRFQFYSEWAVAFVLLACLFGLYGILSTVLNTLYLNAMAVVPVGLGQNGLNYTINLWDTAMVLLFIGIIVWASVSSVRREDDTGRVRWD